MSNANLMELETCILDCIAFCERYPDSDQVRFFAPRLEAARRKYEEGLRVSDLSHTRWRTEEREQATAWKQLALSLRAIQKELHRLGAIDFPATRVMYWDQELLVNAVDQMSAYLRQHANDLKGFAPAQLERLEREMSAARGENREVALTLRTFQRHVDKRREAILELGSLIGEFRVALRRSIGKQDPTYQAIAWPYAIASDDNVLF